MEILLTIHSIFRYVVVLFGLVRKAMGLIYR